MEEVEEVQMRLGLGLGLRNRRRSLISGGGWWVVRVWRCCGVLSLCLFCEIRGRAEVTGNIGVMVRFPSVERKDVISDKKINGWLVERGIWYAGV